jgi:uncharacterized membrane protein
MADISSFAKKIYIIILSFSFLWLLIAIITPVLYSTGEPFSGVATFFYKFFSTVCHQDESRSFHISGHILAVCSRCIWIYGGFFIATALYPFFKKLDNLNLPPIWILLLAAAIVFADSVLNIAEIIPNSFLSRSITGFIIGFVLPFYLIPGFIKFFFEITTFFREKKTINAKKR